MLKNMFSLEGKVAMVSGASSGLGERFATVLAAHGAKLVCVARRMDALSAVAGRISDSGGQALAVSADVTDPEAVRLAFDTAEAELVRYAGGTHNIA